MKKIRSLIYQYGYPFAKMYWFVRRPTTKGVRCIVRNENKLLLIQHTYGSRAFTVPGGGINKNESPIEAVRREVFEEVGLKLETVTILDSIFYNKEYKKDTIYICEANTAQTEIAIDTSEIKKAAWYERSNLPENISPILRKFL